MTVDMIALGHMTVDMIALARMTVDMIALGHMTVDMIVTDHGDRATTSRPVVMEVWIALLERSMTGQFSGIASDVNEVEIEVEVKSERETRRDAVLARPLSLLAHTTRTTVEGVEAEATTTRTTVEGVEAEATTMMITPTDLLAFTPVGVRDRTNHTDHMTTALHLTRVEAAASLIDPLGVEPVKGPLEVLGAIGPLEVR